LRDDIQHICTDTHCTKPAKATRRRIEFSCLVGKRRRPPAILFENIPRDQSYDERRFCSSNGFVNKIGRVVGRDRQKIYWYIHRYISAWDDAERSFFPSSFIHSLLIPATEKTTNDAIKNVSVFTRKKEMSQSSIAILRLLYVNDNIGSITIPYNHSFLDMITWLR